MLGNFSRRSTDQKQRVTKTQQLPISQIRNKTLKSTVLPQLEAKGSTWTLLASIGLRLRQQCQFITLDFFC